MNNYSVIQIVDNDFNYNDFVQNLFNIEDNYITGWKNLNQTISTLFINDELYNHIKGIKGNLAGLYNIVLVLSYDNVFNFIDVENNELEGIYLSDTTVIETNNSFNYCEKLIFFNINKEINNVKNFWITINDESLYLGKYILQNSNIYKLINNKARLYKTLKPVLFLEREVKYCGKTYFTEFTNNLENKFDIIYIQEGLESIANFEIIANNEATLLFETSLKQNFYYDNNYIIKNDCKEYIEDNPYFDYVIYKDNTASIIRYKTIFQEIPEEIDSHPIISFNRIPENLYAKDYLFIPKTIQIIDNRALYNNSKIVAIYFEDNSNLHTIEKSAFEGSALYKIVLPDSVKYIKTRAFANGIYRILIPKNVQIEKDAFIRSIQEDFSEELYLDPPAFSSCLFYKGKLLRNNDNEIINFSYWTNVIENFNYIYEDVYTTDNIEYYKDLNELETWLCFFNGNQKQYTLKEQVNNKKITSINGGLNYNPFFEEIELNKSVFISTYSFSFDTKLKKLTIYTNIGTGIVIGNSSLETIIFGDGVTEIGEGAFLFSSIKEVYLPVSLRKINNGAFTFAKAQSIIWPKELNHEEGVYIGESAFTFMEIEELQIPEYVNYIGKNCFTSSAQYILVYSSAILNCNYSLRLSPISFTSKLIIFLNKPDNAAELISLWEIDSNSVVWVDSNLEGVEVGYGLNINSTGDNEVLFIPSSYGNSNIPVVGFLKNNNWGNIKYIINEDFSGKLYFYNHCFDNNQNIEMICTNSSRAGYFPANGLIKTKIYNEAGYLEDSFNGLSCLTSRIYRNNATIYSLSELVGFYNYTTIPDNLDFSTTKYCILYDDVIYDNEFLKTATENTIVFSAAAKPEDLGETIWGINSNQIIWNFKSNNNIEFITSFIITDITESVNSEYVIIPENFQYNNETLKITGIQKTTKQLQLLSLPDTIDEVIGFTGTVDKILYNNIKYLSGSNQSFIYNLKNSIIYISGRLQNNNQGKEIIIPNQIKSIQDYTFQGRMIINEIPESVQYIGSNNFQSLQKTFPKLNNVKFINSYSFGTDDNIYIPTLIFPENCLWISRANGLISGVNFILQNNSVIRHFRSIEFIHYYKPKGYSVDTFKTVQSVDEYQKTFFPSLTFNWIEYNSIIETDDFIFLDFDNKIILIQIKNTNRSITIPYTYNNKIVELSEACCYENDIVESITFENCDKIPYAAFYSCKNLQQIIFLEPNNTTYIDTQAFKDCTKLENITYLPNLKYIGREAFTNTVFLNNIPKEEGNKYWGNYLIFTSSTAERIKSGTTLISLYENNNITDIPETVKYASGIGTKNNWLLSTEIEKKYLTVPNTGLYDLTIDDFDNCTFYNADGLPFSRKLITEGSNIGKIEFKFFNNSNSQNITYNNKHLTIESSINKIGDFAIPEHIEIVNIHKNVNYVSKYAFENCENIIIFLQSGINTNTWDSEWNYKKFPVVVDYDTNPVWLDNKEIAIFDNLKFEKIEYNNTYGWKVLSNEHYQGGIWIPDQIKDIRMRPYNVVEIIPNSFNNYTNGQIWLPDTIKNVPDYFCINSRLLSDSNNLKNIGIKSIPNNNRFITNAALINSQQKIINAFSYENQIIAALDQSLELIKTNAFKNYKGPYIIFIENKDTILSKIEENWNPDNIPVVYNGNDPEHLEYDNCDGILTENNNVYLLLNNNEAICLNITTDIPDELNYNEKIYKPTILAPNSCSATINMPESISFIYPGAVYLGNDREWSKILKLPRNKDIIIEPYAFISGNIWIPKEIKKIPEFIYETDIFMEETKENVEIYNETPPDNIFYNILEP